MILHLFEYLKRHSIPIYVKIFLHKNHNGGINYSILNLLDIEDKNIVFSDFPIEVVSFGHIRAKRIHAYLNHSFDSCPCCHISNPKIHKHGSKTSNIILNHAANYPIILALKKQRNLCSPRKQSEKDIALNHFVSASTVNRSYDRFNNHFKLNLHHLPIALSFDEFKATNDTKGKMAFIYTNAETGQIIDIIDSKKNTT